MRALCLVVFAAIYAGWCAADVPTSARAQQAIERQKAPLQADLEAAGFKLGSPIFIQITKYPAELTVYIRNPDNKYDAFRTYPICAYSGGLGPKRREGDGKSPEGFYSVRSSQMNPASSYHLSFNLGFPNAHDRSKGYTGSFLMVHGRCASIGCYAMTDPVIEEIWTLMDAAYEAGQREVPVHVYPFPMEWLPIAEAMDHPETSFWRELAPGWNSFESSKLPPQVSVVEGRYVIREPQP